jgi:hypothetical protein
MTEEQILELAEKLEFCYRDEDDWRKWKVSSVIILKFALAIHEDGYNKGYGEGWREGYDVGVIEYSND